MKTANIQRIAPSGSLDQWPETVRAALAESDISANVGEKLVYENENFRVWTIHLEAGKSLPFHRHQRAYFWTVLTTGKTRSYYEDGSVIEREYHVGDTVYFDQLSGEQSFAHNLENIGDSMLIFTTVEFFNPF